MAPRLQDHGTQAMAHVGGMAAGSHAAAAPCLARLAGELCRAAGKAGTVVHGTASQLTGAAGTGIGSVAAGTANAQWYEGMRSRRRAGAARRAGNRGSSAACAPSAAAAAACRNRENNRQDTAVIACMHSLFLSVWRFAGTTTAATASSATCCSAKPGVMRLKRPFMLY